MGNFAVLVVSYPQAWGAFCASESSFPLPFPPSSLLSQINQLPLFASTTCQKKRFLIPFQYHGLGAVQWTKSTALARGPDERHSEKQSSLTALGLKDPKRQFFFKVTPPQQGI